MAKISAKKSDLKTIANKIIVSPSTAAVSDLKFKRKKDFSTFVKWIESSNKALAGIKLPKKKEVEKLEKKKKVNKKEVANLKRKVTNTKKQILAAEEASKTNDVDEAVKFLKKFSK